MKRDVETSIRAFLIEFVVYAALVAVYYFLVLHFLGDWLSHLFNQDRRTYAVVALALIIGQGFLLEVLTRVLLTWIHPRGNRP
jgi:hypothetical protein